MSEASLDSMGELPTRREQRAAKRRADKQRAAQQTFRPKKQRRGPISKLFRALMWLVLIVVLLLLLVLVLAYAVTATDKGFNFAVSQASERVDGLEIIEPSGNLSNGINASGLSFKNDSIDVQMSGLDSAWQSSCLIDKKFCVDRLIVDKMRVEMLAEPVPAPDEGPRTEAIELPSIPLPLDVNLDDVQVKEFVFKPFGDAPEQIIKNVRLQASNLGNALSIEQLSADYQNFSADISGDITLEDDYPLDVNIVANGTDVVDEHDFQVNLHATNSIEDLVFDGTVSGAADVVLSGTAKPLDHKLPVTLNVNADAVGWPLDTLQIAKAEQLALSVNGDLDDFNVTLNTDVSGENIPQTSLNLQAIANPSRVMVPVFDVQTLGGSIVGSASSTLDEEILWESIIVIKDIDPSGVAAEISGELSGEIIANGGVLDGQWKLDLTKGTINGMLQGFPFDLDALVSKSYEERWTVEKVVLNNGANQINAKGSASDTLDFTADINLEQLQNFLPGLAGGFDANLAISGQPSEPNVTLQAETAALKYNDLLITGLNLNADVARGAKQPSSLELVVNQIQQGDQLVQNAKINLDGTLAEHALKLFADGPQATAIDLTAEGGLSDTFDWLGQMQAVTLELPAHKVNLAEPFDLGWDNDIKKASIGAHCWSTEETRLCLENDVVAEPTGTADITLTQYPLARLDPFLPAGSELQGVVKADATVKWGEQYPGGFDASLKTQINDGGIKVEDDAFDELSFAYDLFNLDANATGEEISADIALKSKALGNAAVDFTMDPSQESKPISGDISLEGLNISFLKAFLPDFDEISGVVNAGGKLSGSLTDPNFNGSIVLNSPIAQAESLPLSIDGGKVTVNVDGKRATIKGDLASGEGNVGVTGNADWNNIAAWNADIIVKGTDLNVQSPPLEESSVFTNVRISLRPGNVRVAGDIEVPMAEIEVAELPSGASTLSDDIVIIEDEAAAQAAAKENEQVAPAGSTDVDVRLNVSLGDDVNLQAYGLEAALTGDMTVEVSPPKPVQLGGEITIVEGIFKQYGQDLKVENGQVLFVGPVEQTQLAMDAVRTIENEDRVAGLRIGGRVAEPTITLFTDPADKPQDAILSYILLGRDINQASDAEQNLLASAALALTLKGGQGTANRIASSLGIKDFTLGSQGKGDDTQVVVSGRLNDRLLLRYGQNVFSSNGGTLFLRYDLTKKLYLEASEGAERAVDLFYSFSF